MINWTNLIIYFGMFITAMILWYYIVKWWL